MQTEGEQAFLMERARDRAFESRDEKECGFHDCSACGRVECPRYECYSKTPCEECEANARCLFFLNGQ